ncbi:MAG: hypothetical protein ACTHZ7_13770 [Sphingobacterium sp.]
MRPSKKNKIENTNRIEHIWVPLLLILMNINLVQTVFLVETQVDGPSSWLLIISSNVSLILLTVALWRKQRSILWVAMSAYGLQTILLIWSSI